MLGRTALTVLALLASVAEALVVTLPTAVSIWTCVTVLFFSGLQRLMTRHFNDGRSEGAARIEWSLLPETFPPPATPVRTILPFLAGSRVADAVAPKQFFDVYIRNGVGAMYTPSLNVRRLPSVPRVFR